MTLLKPEKCALLQDISVGDDLFQNSDLTPSQHEYIDLWFMGIDIVPICLQNKNQKEKRKPDEWHTLMIQVNVNCGPLWKCSELHFKIKMTPKKKSHLSTSFLQEIPPVTLISPKNSLCQVVQCIFDQKGIGDIRLKMQLNT